MAKKAVLLLLVSLLLLILPALLKTNQQELDVVMGVTVNQISFNGLQVNPLRIALGTGISPESNIEYYWALVKFIESKLGQKVEIVQRQSYAEINYLLSLELVDLALICSSSYVIAGEDSQVELLAIPEINGEYEYHSLIIVRADSDITNFADLRGKIFAFSDPMSTTGFYYPAYRLQELGSSPHQFFSSFFFTYSHDNSIYAVLNGLADGAAVDSTVYNKVYQKNPAIGDQIAIIEKSPSFLNSPIVVRSSLDQELKETLVNLLTSVSEDQDSKNVFRKYGIDGYRQEPPPGKSYEPIKQMIREVRKNHEPNF